MPDTEILRIIRASGLGRENRKIARMVLIDRMPMVDVGAQMGYHRTSISRRMAEIEKKMKEMEH